MKSTQPFEAPLTICFFLFRFLSFCLFLGFVLRFRFLLFFFLAFVFFFLFFLFLFFCKMTRPCILLQNIVTVPSRNVAWSQIMRITELQLRLREVVISTSLREWADWVTHHHRWSPLMGTYWSLFTMRWVGRFIILPQTKDGRNISYKNCGRSGKSLATLYLI